ncbi:DUF4435 domain-containing protein [Methylovulum psychrotolerans]|uniref:Group-specific protein n=1 Tax=Methylovulum psychrotolerans TaxID=1704499 RepID=A0A1Z4C1R9_9GAMM|nr:DUF4435 domain-containing protein [Methylovulum psychrotolerans]ASF47461.1 group-specific protein [Methylovulum psychrotolerans]
MEFLEALRQGRFQPTAAYSDFMYLTEKHEHSLFCFYEGKDSAYYVPRIKRFTAAYQNMLCGGREKVLEVYRLIAGHAEYDCYKKAFFIDRDFNLPLTPHSPPIFETPCYAIENFYVSIEVFQDILKNSLHLSERNEAYQTCVRLFMDRQHEFHQATLLFNAWYACLISLKNSTNEQTGVNLDEKFPKGFISFTDLNAVSAHYTFDTLKQTFANALDVPETVLEAKKAEFAICQYHQEFRGKYELWFVLTFIELILKDSKTTKTFLKEKINFSFSDKLSNDQAIELFSIHAETPDSLYEYLRQVTS